MYKKIHSIFRKNKPQLITFFSIFAVIALYFNLLSTSTSVYAVGGNNKECSDAQAKDIEPNSENEPNNATYPAPSGNVITQVCIKSGNNMYGGEHGIFTQNGTTPEGCYTIAGIGTQTVTVTQNTPSNSCQGISHIDVYYSQQPTNTPTPTPTDQVTNTPTPTEMTPTQTPTPTDTPTPTSTPILTSTPGPTNTPTPTTRLTSTPGPTNTPTQGPTSTPGQGPTATPTSVPTPTPGGVGGFEAGPGEVLGVNSNPLIEGIQSSYGGQVLGATTVPSTGSDDESSEKLPSNNEKIEGLALAIPAIEFEQEVYQGQNVGSMPIVGDDEVIRSAYNENVYYGHNTKEVFESLVLLNYGNQIVVNKNGTDVTYQVTYIQYTYAGDTQIMETSGDTIKLVTCDLTNPELRLVVHAEKVQN